MNMVEQFQMLLIAGDLNSLGPGLLNCTRDFIPHTEGIEEKDDNENNE